MTAGYEPVREARRMWERTSDQLTMDVEVLEDARRDDAAPAGLTATRSGDDVALPSSANPAGILEHLSSPDRRGEPSPWPLPNTPLPGSVPTPTPNTNGSGHAHSEGAREAGATGGDST
jgi:hypothetical protein